MKNMKKIKLTLLTLVACTLFAHVITSYSIHYTKLYEKPGLPLQHALEQGRLIDEIEGRLPHGTGQGVTAEGGTVRNNFV